MMMIIRIVLLSVPLTQTLGKASTVVNSHAVAQNIMTQTYMMKSRELNHDADEDVGIAEAVRTRIHWLLRSGNPLATTSLNTRHD